MPQPKHAAGLRFEGSTVDMARDRAIVERSDLVLACAHLLHTNGQSTHETVQAAERLGNELGLRATIIANWEDLELRATDCTGNQVSFERGTPTGMNMDRVASAMSAIEDFAGGRRAIGAALENIKAIGDAPPAPTWLFTLAAAGCCCDGGDLRGTPPRSRGAHHDQRGGRSSTASHTGAVQPEHSFADTLCSFARGHDWCACGAL